MRIRLLHPVLPWASFFLLIVVQFFLIGRHHLKSGHSVTPAPCQHAWVCASCRKCSNVLQTRLRAAVWTRTLFNDVNHRGSWADSHAIKGTGGGGVWASEPRGTTLWKNICICPDFWKFFRFVYFSFGIRRRKISNWVKISHNKITTTVGTFGNV